ncbi:hypothetical protein B0293_07700 [Amycolatopsis azurea DSM 43854]|uniref:HTH cro/C1-type domain-containing protein n=1 Tax=Amycolatopsis azurea DSM 43854 TaxID=1238180 RepID=A0ABX3JIG1_9PSEU|nr:hypothetical protein B0293_07700 [Amycolatopsis azurea DSM 43854]
MQNIGPTGERVAHNLRALRGVMTYKELSDRLDRLGRPIPVLGLSRIENNARRVDADDLIALALALNVPPNRLLLPVDGSSVPLTTTVEEDQEFAWRWAYGEEPLLRAAAALEGPEAAYDDLYESFVRRGRPDGDRQRDQDTAVRAAEDVLYLINTIVEKRRQAEGEARQDSTEDLRRNNYGRQPDPRPLPERLKGALKRLLAEVDDMPEAHDGNR